MKRWLKVNEGFTLIEMVMVLVIIGLLASIVVPKFTAQMEDARATTTKANLDNLRTAIGIYVQRIGDYPTDLEDMETTTPPVMENVPIMDAWGFAFEYGTDHDVRCNPSSPNCDPGGLEGW